MHARFYAPAAQEPGETITLPADEAEHLTRVLRLTAGDAIRVFNGRGEEFTARVEIARRRTVRVTVDARTAAAVEPRARITILPAVLKPDNMDDVVRDAVMMGVTAIQPVVAARSETSVAALERGGRQGRWTRIAIASTKQCGRAIVPPVHAPIPLSTAFDRIGGTIPAPAFMFVEPGAADGAIFLEALDRAPPPHATVVLGPEGGWTPEELHAAAERAQLVTLRLPTIRANAMSTVALAALLAAWGEI